MFMEQYIDWKVCLGSHNVDAEHDLQPSRRFMHLPEIDLRAKEAEKPLTQNRRSARKRPSAEDISPLPKKRLKRNPNSKKEPEVCTVASKVLVSMFSFRLQWVLLASATCSCYIFNTASITLPLPLHSSALLRALSTRASASRVTNRQ